MSKLLKVNSTGIMTISTVPVAMNTLALQGIDGEILDHNGNLLIDMRDLVDKDRYYTKAEITNRITDIVANSLTPKPEVLVPITTANENSTERITFSNHVAGTVYTINTDLGTINYTVGNDYFDITFNDITANVSGVIVITAQEGTKVPSQELILPIDVMYIPDVFDQVLSNTNFATNAYYIENIEFKI